MIVRVHGSGQYRLDDTVQAELDQIDGDIVDAVSRKDTDGAHSLLRKAAELVEAKGTPLANDDLSSSDLILPDAEATLEELESDIQSLLHGQ